MAWIYIEATTRRAGADRGTHLHYHSSDFILAIVIAVAVSLSRFVMASFPILLQINASTKTSVSTSYYVSS